MDYFEITEISVGLSDQLMSFIRIHQLYANRKRRVWLISQVKEVDNYQGGRASILRQQVASSITAQCNMHQPTDILSTGIIHVGYRIFSVL